jgi:hypothetical protein
MIPTLYVKISVGINQSSMWNKPGDYWKLWLYILTLKNAAGEVSASVPGLAHNCSLSIDKVREILAYLQSPDPESRSPSHEGRRLLEIQGGWYVVNHEVYRGQNSASDRARYKAEYIARARALEKEADKLNRQQLPLPSRVRL